MLDLFASSQQIRIKESQDLQENYPSSLFLPGLCRPAAAKCPTGRLLVLPALIASVKLLADQLKALVTILLNIIESYSSLVGICEVFNMENCE